MPKHKVRVFENAIVIAILTVAYCLLLYRSCLSVELTDEAYGIAEIYNASFGKRPFVDIWDPHPGWFLYVPFLKLFQIFSPSLYGCVLYFRLVYFFLATIIMFVAYKLNKEASLLTFIASVGYVCFSIPQMGHNAGVSFLLILAYCFMCENRRLWHRFFSGIIMGIVCILYPTMAVIAALLTIPVLILSEKKLKMVLAYCGGVALVGLAFFLWILAGSEDMNILLTGIKATITTPHEANKGNIDILFLQKTFSDRLSVFYTTERSIIWIAHIVIALVIKIVQCKKRWKYDYFLHVEYLLFIVFASVQIFIDPNVHPLSRGGYISYTIYIGLVYLIVLNWKQIRKQSKLLTMIAFGWIITYCFSSDNKNLFFGMDAAGALVVFTACYTVLASTDGTIIDNVYRGKKQEILIRIVFPAVLMFIGTACYWGYVYRDAPVGELKSKVNYGIYAGLYTTEDNVQYVERLEKDIEVVTAGHENIFVVNNMPSIYLMSKVMPFTPQTWDAQFLARGYTSAEPVLSYFHAKNQNPEVVVANDHISSSLFEREDIEIWGYITEYYELVDDFEYDEVAGKMKVWEQKKNIPKWSDND